jgi:hypothetical protein
VGEALDDVEEVQQWHKDEFSKVMAKYLETNSRASWLSSEERQVCILRMPVSERKRRRLLGPP